MRGFSGIRLAAVLISLAAAACAPAGLPRHGADGHGNDGQPTASRLTASADTPLGKLIGIAPETVVEGERLDAERLRRFYARHGFAPVWTAARLPQASALTQAVLRAGDHGLAPELFHADLLRTAENLPALHRELVLSHAFLSYADALARGAVSVERRRENETLKATPIDVAAALDSALGSGDAAAAIEALAPQTPTYRLLRQALRDLRAGNPAQGTAEAAARRRAIEVNLERERWLPRRMPADRVWVNVADQRLTMFRDDRPIFSTRVIVGRTEKANQTPEFQVPLDAIWFNPPWNIPEDIARNEILPKARSDPSYLARHNMVLLPDGMVQQRAGPYSALGTLLFDMNNRFEVYLHDTPSKELFLREDRNISHGCIRVENPRQLAALLMQQPPLAIDQAIATGSTVRTPVPKVVPVFIVYQTVFADPDAKVHFRPDAYGRDAGIWRSLLPQRQVAAAR